MWRWRVARTARARNRHRRRPRPRGDHDRQQRDPPPCAHASGVGRDGLRPHGRVVDDGRATIGHVGDTRLYKIRDGRSRRSRAITRRSANAKMPAKFRARGDAPPAAERGVSRLRLRRCTSRRTPSSSKFRRLPSSPMRRCCCAATGSPISSTRPRSSASCRVRGRPGPRRPRAHRRRQRGRRQGQRHGCVHRGRRLRREQHGHPAQRDSPVRRRTGGSLAARPHARWPSSQLVCWRGSVALARRIARPRVGRPSSPPPHIDVQHVNAPASIGAALTRATPGSEIVVGTGRIPRAALPEGRRPSSSAAFPAGRRFGCRRARLTAPPSSQAACRPRNSSDSGSWAMRRLLWASGFSWTMRPCRSWTSRSRAPLGRASSLRCAAGDARGQRIHDNAGAAVVIDRSATPRIAHNTFSRNGCPRETAAFLIVEAGAAPTLLDNVFVGVAPETLALHRRRRRGYRWRRQLVHSAGAARTSAASAAGRERKK